MLILEEQRLRCGTKNDLKKVPTVRGKIQTEKTRKSQLGTPTNLSPLFGGIHFFDGGIYELY